MSRKIRCIAISLAFAALVTASTAHASPSRLRASEAAAEAGLLASAWEWLLSLMSSQKPGQEIGITGMWGTDTCSLDPNG
jgi:hypothetical protein